MTQFDSLVSLFQSSLVSFRGVKHLHLRELKFPTLPLNANIEIQSDELFQIDPIQLKWVIISMFSWNFVSFDLFDQLTYDGVFSSYFNTISFKLVTNKLKDTLKHLNLTKTWYEWLTKYVSDDHEDESL